VWNGGNYQEAEKLESCYQNALQLAVDYGCRTIAFPNISTGVFRFPKVEAAKIAISTVNEYLSGTDKIDKVIFICFDDENYRLYKEMIFPY